MTSDNANLNSSTVSSPHSFNNGVSKNIVSSIVTLFSQTGLFLQRTLQRMDEPRISQVRTRSGNVLWHVYDPLSRRSVVLGSEAEVRTWLEQRFHSAF